MTDARPKQQISYDKNNPFMARLIERRCLSKPGSQKDTQHFVVDLSGSGLTYACGDSLGVFPSNDPYLVDLLITSLGAIGNELIELPKHEAAIPFREALECHLSLSAPSKKALEWLHEKITDTEQRGQLESLLRPENEEVLKSYLASHDWVDLFEDFSSATKSIDPQEVVLLMRRLVPRLYSIASSPKCHPEHIHLTVGVVSHEHRGRIRKGVATSYLAERVPLNEPALPVFVAPSHFGLPEDSSVDMIMVGPGTGVAPFRAFLQERIATGATGRHWLFFGDQHRACDYLYEDEFEAWHNEGKLDRLDLAFSRDQEYKIYVQDRMLEHAQELWTWIQGGAYFYVCGDAKRMAKDVEAALISIIQVQGRFSEDEAQGYVKEMRKQKRYQKDVY
jgi:sulfite reductase (NADPH) flavoprotein alpha-component